MKCSCGSYANKRLSCPFYLSFFFSFEGFFEQWTPTYHIFFFSCHEQCCLFEFLSLAVILKHSLHFINFIPYLMADPSHPFVSVLMTLVPKRGSLRIPKSFSLKHYHPCTLINQSIITPVKNQGSSCRKGKEAVSDDPATRDVGKKAAYSKSDHSDKEEARHDPNSEYTPLIDPWYDTHAHFPKVPSEYTPLPLGHVWLALCRRNTDISWASLASSIPDLVICQGTSLPVPILFKFGSGTALGWK